MKKYTIFCSFSLIIAATIPANFAHAVGVEIIVNKATMTFDAAKSVSEAANYVVSADAMIKWVNNGLSIIPSGQIGNVIKLGANAKYIFIAPLVDGRYFIQALTEGDYKIAAWHGLKIYTYFFNPICFQGITGAENLLTLFGVYQRAVEFKGRFKEDWERMTKESICSVM